MACDETPEGGNLRETCGDASLTCGKSAVVLILLAEARRKGVEAQIDGDQLRVRGPREHELLIRSIVARKPDVIAALSVRGSKASEASTASTSTPAPPPGDAEADAALAEVMALLERVKRPWWAAYIRTRLEVDTGNTERLRRIREWVESHPVAFTPPEADAGAESAS